MSDEEPCEPGSILLPFTRKKKPGVPMYDLQLLQQLVGQGALSRVITRTALNEAGLLGFQEADIVEAVLALTPAHFYKSMEAEKCPGSWQDVYHGEYQDIAMYIKLQLAPDRRAVVIQCKRK